MECRDLYRLAESRFRPFLKAPVSCLRRSHHTRSSHGGGGGGEEEEEVSDPAGAATQSVLGPATTDDVLGSAAIPEFGFTLRTISGGGQSSGTSCLNCHWLHRCHGCVISSRRARKPGEETFRITLHDGETIAVDWHYVVFEDLLDSYAAAYMHPHKSLALLGTGDLRFNRSQGPVPGPLISDSDEGDGGDHGDGSNDAISITKCLDKFTEEVIHPNPNLTFRLSQMALRRRSSTGTAG